METTQSSAENWFDRINSAILTWYGVYAQNQPAPTGTGGSGSVVVTPTGGGGVAASISLPVLIVGAAVIIGAIYVYKKA